ncbi:MAG: hypothetical protein EBZ77_17430 [Chitinophagia bacterium]|nr:hypothetical protein [Chitinophagia bacterium]
MTRDVVVLVLALVVVVVVVSLASTEPLEPVDRAEPLDRVEPLDRLSSLDPMERVASWTKTQKVVIGGTARDCAPYLGSVLARLDELARWFGSVRYVFYESNSSDATYAILRSFVAARDGVVLTERTRGTRTERIAIGRNAVVARAEHSGADFFVNVDMDDRCTDIDVPSVVECVSRSAEWDVATSNRRVDYYDLWALRTPALGNCYAPGDACETHPVSDWFPSDPELAGARTFPTTKTRPYYDVLSAFAGLAVYKTSVIRGARYSGNARVAAGVVPECEHAPFHAAIRALSPGARIVVATYMFSGP